MEKRTTRDDLEEGDDGMVIDLHQSATFFKVKTHVEHFFSGVISRLPH